MPRGGKGAVGGGRTGTASYRPLPPLFTSGLSLQLYRDVVDAESLHALLNLLQHGLIVGRVLDHQMPAHGYDAARYGPEVQVVDRLDTRYRRDTVMDIR